MNTYHAHADPPRTLPERLAQLNQNLQVMAGRLKDAIASVVGKMIGQAIRDVLRRMLGDQEQPGEPDRFTGRFDRESRDPYGGRYERDHDAWYDDRDDPWSEENQEAVYSASASSIIMSSRWGDAFRTAAQTALWWLRTQPCRRPFLATTIVALTAGGTALFAGPTLAACVGVVASVASLLLTADSVRTASEMAGAAAS